MTAVVPLPDPVTLTAAVEAAARCLWEDIFIAAGDEIAWSDVDEPMVRNGMLADAERLVDAVAPIIAAAERERIALAIEAKADALNVDDVLENELILVLDEAAEIARAGTSEATP